MWLELGYFNINPWFENCKLGLERLRVQVDSPGLEGGGGRFTRNTLTFVYKNNVLQFKKLAVLLSKNETF